MLTVVALLIAIPKVLFMPIHYLLKNKTFLIIAIIGIGAVVVIGQFNKSGQINTANVPSYQVIAPNISQATKVVRTSSRVYYVATMQDDGVTVLLTNYYAYDKDTWRHSDKPLPLDRNIYGVVQIYNR